MNPKPYLALALLAFVSDLRAEKRLPPSADSIAALQGKVATLETEYGAERDRLARFLGYVDLTLGIQVAEGGMKEVEADEWLRQRAQHLFAHSFEDREMDQVFQQWRQAAQGFLDRVEKRTAAGVTWPADATAASYRELAAATLRTQRGRLPESLGARPDAESGLLAVAEEVRNWTQGRRQPGTLAEAVNRFSSSRARVDALLQTQRDTAMSGGGAQTNQVSVLDSCIRITTLEGTLEHLHANRIPEAVQGFRELVKAKPGDDELLRLWVIMEIIAKEDLPSARRVADQLAARHPDEAQYLMVQGQATFFSQDLDEGIRLLSAAGKADPNLVQGMYQQANDMLSKGVPAVAYVQYCSLAYMQPPYTPAFYGLGFAAKSLGYREVAVDAFQNYLKFDSTSPYVDNARRELEAMGER